MNEVSPGLILIVGSGLVPLLPRQLRIVYMLALPILAFGHMLTLSYGEFGQVGLFDLSLVTLRVDRLSLLFGYIFAIAAWLGILYAAHIDETVQQVAALIYAGSAIAAVFAGDLVTLFIFWEGTAIASAFLIWARGTEQSYRAGMRYLMYQVSSGVLLLAGIVVHWRATGSLAFEPINLSGLAAWLIFIAFGIKCAFPLLHNWLQDAYPEGTVSGTVILSAFTTKLAVYALARGFPGTDILVPIGATMTAFPIFYAVIENDLRRVLAYSLNNQLGFMVVGVGIGTELSLNGTAAHAFSHILYKALLFMSMGAVLYRAGTIKGSELGGLYKTMPWTAGFCIIGAASISAFPLFSGFISKGLIIAAAMKEGYFWTWLVLLFASAGVFHHSGIKIPYFAFFAHDSGKRPQEAPGHMLAAMAITAALCVLIGVFPGPLYAILPYPVDFVPYTVEHVVTQLQLLVFSALAFTVLMRTGLYPPELRSTNLDFDWFYRVPGRWIAEQAISAFTASAEELGHLRRLGVREIGKQLYPVIGPQGTLARTWSIGFAVLLVTAVLGVSLLFNFFWQLPG